MFTYPGFEEVPRVVNSADGTRPPTACTVQSHTRFFFFIAKNYSKHKQPSQMQKKQLLREWMARARVLRVSHSTGEETGSCMSAER